MLRHVALMILTLAGPGQAQAPARADHHKGTVQQKRDAVDEMARDSLDRLLAESPEARRMFDRSVAYAVFDNFKAAFLLSAGGGIGVAVDRSSRDRTYMKMGTAGIGLGIGGQSYTLVFLFADRESFRAFVDKGWHADAIATAALWSKGATAEASFTHGLAVYQLTNRGVMAGVDLSGTKYWKHGTLNEPHEARTTPKGGKR